MDSGLEGLIAAETVLSHSDGAQGILWVRGYTLVELVARFGYEGAVALLWEEFAAEAGFAHRPDRDALRAQLGAARQAAFAALDRWLDRAVSRPVVEG
ncbi:MAG: citrate/2-methylcitrate synthase, partial [Stellaceae bacterium]